MSNKRTALWREAHFEVETRKTHHSRTTFGSCDVVTRHCGVTQQTYFKRNTAASDLHITARSCRPISMRASSASYIHWLTHTHAPHPHRPHRREIYLLLREVFAALDQRRCFGEFCQEPGFKSWTPSGISSHP